MDISDDEIEVLPSQVKDGFLSGVITLDEEILSLLSSERLMDLNDNEVELERDGKNN